MPIKTEVTTFSREAGGRGEQYVSAQAFPEVPIPAPATEIEIVERTVQTKVRSDGYPDRSVSPIETERLIATLSIEEAANLSASLTRSIISALDTRR